MGVRMCAAAVVCAATDITRGAVSTPPSQGFTRGDTSCSGPRTLDRVGG